MENLEKEEKDEEVKQSTEVEKAMKRLIKQHNKCLN